MNRTESYSSAENGTGLAENTASGSGSTAPAPWRAALACETCRASKVRCTRAGSDTGPCDRCCECYKDGLGRMGLTCSDPQVRKKRGRPSKGAGNYRQSVSFADGDHHGDDLPPPHHQYHLPRPSLPQIPPSHSRSTITETSWNRTSNGGVSIHPYKANQSPGQQHDQVTPGSSSHTGPSPQTSNSTTTAAQLRYSSKGDKTLTIGEFLDPGDRMIHAEDPKAPFYLTKPEDSARNEARDGSQELDPDNPERDDPVALRIVSLAESQELVRLFHERLNPMVAVLDPRLHTVDYLRRTSSILFTSVLAAASKFYRKNLHQSLLSHAQTLVDRALTSGIADIGLVQSLMFLTYWKSPLDTSAWRKIGIAMRMGYQFGWYRPRRHPLPSDDFEARQILNAERTWMCEYIGDTDRDDGTDEKKASFALIEGKQSNRDFIGHIQLTLARLAHTFGLPTTIKVTEMIDAETWAREHLHLGWSVDMHLALSQELCKWKDNWRIMLDGVGEHLNLASTSAIDNAALQLDVLLKKWYGGIALPGFDSEAEIVVKWTVLHCRFIVKRQQIEMASEGEEHATKQVPYLLDQCLNVICEIVDLVEEVARRGLLVVMQDTGSCMTSTMVVFLKKAFAEMTSGQKSLVVSLLWRLLEANQSVSEGDPDAATAFAARFIRRILGAIGTESRHASPGPSGAQNEPLDFDFLAGLDEFIQSSEDVGVEITQDAVYWAPLFSVDPFSDVNGGFAPFG